MAAGASAYIPAIIAALGPVLSGLFSDDPQERQSFEGKGAISPEAMMRQNNTLLTRYGGALTRRVGEPVSLPSAYVQTPGAYTGGGLPFPIGIVATDPALTNPSLLSRPGVSGFEGLFEGLGNGDEYTYGVQKGPNNPTNVGARGGPPGVGPQDGFGPDGQRLPGFDDFYEPNFTPQSPWNPNGTTDGLEPRPDNTAEYRDGTGDVFADDGEYGELVRAGDLDFTGDRQDDLGQAMGAIQLFLDAQQRA